MSRRTAALRKLVVYGATEGERKAAAVALANHQPPVAYHAHDADGMTDTARVELPDGDSVHRWLRSTEPVVVRWRGVWWMARGCTGAESGCCHAVLLGMDRLTRLKRSR